MSTFDSLDLFASGPHRFHIGGLALRHVLSRPPDDDGVALTSLGRGGRLIIQQGELSAESPEALRELIAAIEARLDGIAHELIDDQDHTWPNTVMTAFTPEPIVRSGPTWRVTYRIEYLQLTP